MRDFRQGPDSEARSLLQVAQEKRNHGRSHPVSETDTGGSGSSETARETADAEHDRKGLKRCLLPGAFCDDLVVQLRGYPAESYLGRGGGSGPRSGGCSQNEQNNSKLPFF